MTKIFVNRYRKVRKRVKANGKAHRKRESIGPFSASFCMFSPSLYICYNVFESKFFCSAFTEYLAKYLKLIHNL